MNKQPENIKKIGLALGSGSARGFSHIGILQALEEMGIKPDIVCGVSMGAIIGAAYCSGTLASLTRWASSLDRATMLHYFDINWLGHGGPIKGEQLLEFLRKYIADQPMNTLSQPFGVVATDLSTGEDVWLREGSLLDAVRASAALPGILPPWPRLRQDGTTQWLIDGGLVDPVPVALCREMGADIVIAVNLNECLVKTPEKTEEAGKINGQENQSAESKEEKETAIKLLEKLPLIDKLPKILSPTIKSGVQEIFNNNTPSYLNVVVNSIKIMQYQIAHIRLKEHAPDVLLTPHLGHIDLLAFDQAPDIITEGRVAVFRAQERLRICQR
jgi:NTE family protein